MQNNTKYSLEIHIYCRKRIKKCMEVRAMNSGSWLSPRREKGSDWVKSAQGDINSVASVYFF